MPPKKMVKPFHSAPAEIVDNIMFFALHTGNETSPFLQDDDITGHWMDFRARQRSFCRTFLPVSQSVYRSAMKVLWRCIYLTCPEDLEEIWKITTDGPRFGGPLDLGSFCRRMEVRICGVFEDALLCDLIQRTQSLEVFILRTSGNIIHRSSIDRPGAIIRSILRFAPKIRRLQFECTTGDPSLLQLNTVLLSLPLLVTLHVDRVASTTWNEEDVPTLTKPAGSLRVLSIGSVRRMFQTDYSPPSHHSGLLLRMFKSSAALPSLTSLYIQRTPSFIREFLAVFGAQILELGYSVGNRTATPGPYRWKHIIDYCPRLEKLLCFGSKGLHWMETFRPIPAHAVLTEIHFVFALRFGTNKRAQGWIIHQGLHFIEQQPPPKLRKLTLVTPNGNASFMTTRSFRSLRRSLKGMGVQTEGPTMIV